jgi:S-formylglutathione hydrolase FrmB
VLLPAGYGAQPARAWPVLYVVPGSGCDGDIAMRDLDLASWTGRQDAIVAIVWETGNDGWNYVTDYHDGSSPLDREFVDDVVPWVDDQYRTEPNRRAIAGYSSGGYSAAEIPTRHRRLFSAVGTFSGVVDITDRDPAGEWAVLAPNLATDALDGQDDALRRWGDPVTDAANWHAMNPADHAGGLRGTRVVYISAGDGVPDGDQPSVTEDPTNAVALATKIEAEEQIGSMTAAYDRALTRAGVAHVYRAHHGIHAAPDWRVDLATFWALVRRQWGLDR